MSRVSHVSLLRSLLKVFFKCLPFCSCPFCQSVAVNIVAVTVFLKIFFWYKSLLSSLLLSYCRWRRGVFRRNE